MTCRLVWTALAGGILATTVPAAAGANGRGYFSHSQAKKALELAQQECKPLVLHFYLDNASGRTQLAEYYLRSGGISAEVLDHVVVVALPLPRYAGFAKSLGVYGDGGMRTISPFDLNAVGFNALGTLSREVYCQPGFR